MPSFKGVGWCIYFGAPFIIGSLTTALLVSKNKSMPERMVTSGFIGTATTIATCLTPLAILWVPFAFTLTFLIQVPLSAICG